MQDARRVRQFGHLSCWRLHYRPVNDYHLSSLCPHALDVSTPPVSAASVTHSEPSPTDSTSTSSARECHDTPATDGEEEESTVLLAFTRVFSGTLRPNRSLLVLRARHDPSDFADGSQETDDPARYPRQEDDAAIVSCQPTQLYMLMGRELIAIDSAPAGSIVGVAGIDSQVCEMCLYLYRRIPTHCPLAVHCTLALKRGMGACTGYEPVFHLVIAHPPKTLKLTQPLIRFLCGRCATRQHRL